MTKKTKPVERTLEPHFLAVQHLRDTFGPNGLRRLNEKLQTTGDPAAQVERFNKRLESSG